MTPPTSYQISQSLSTNPYQVKSSNAFVDTPNNRVVFCFDTTYDRNTGIKELQARGIFRKDITTFSIDKAFKSRFRVSISE